MLNTSQFPITPPNFDSRQQANDLSHLSHPDISIPNISIPKEEADLPPFNLNKLHDFTKKGEGSQKKDIANLNIRQNQEQVIINELDNVISSVDSLYLQLLPSHPLKDPHEMKRKIDRLTKLFNFIIEKSALIHREKITTYSEKKAAKFSDLNHLYHVKISHDLKIEIDLLPNSYPRSFHITRCESICKKFNELRFKFESISERFSLLANYDRISFINTYREKHTLFSQHEQLYTNWLKKIERKEVNHLFYEQKAKLDSILAYTGNINLENLSELQNQICLAVAAFENIMEACSQSSDCVDISEQCYICCGKLSELWTECFHKEQEAKFDRIKALMNPPKIIGKKRKG